MKNKTSPRPSPKEREKQKKSPAKRWHGVRKKTVNRKRSEPKGKVTYYKLFGKAQKKYQNKIYAASVTLINPHKGKHALEKWADEVDKKGKLKGLEKIVVAQDGTGKPKKCTVIVVQRNRVKPHRFGYTNYMSGDAFKVNEKNVKSFIVGVLRGHEENIRQQIIRRGYRDKKYDEGNFKAWHVPYLDINIHYKLPSFAKATDGKPSNKK